LPSSLLPLLNLTMMLGVMSENDRFARALGSLFACWQTSTMDVLRTV
jgi:hypothetical protein